MGPCVFLGFLELDCFCSFPHAAGWVRDIRGSLKVKVFLGIALGRVTASMCL